MFWKKKKELKSKNIKVSYTLKIQGMNEKYCSVKGELEKPVTQEELDKNLGKHKKIALDSLLKQTDKILPSDTYIKNFNWDMVEYITIDGIQLLEE